MSVHEVFRCPNPALRLSIWGDGMKKYVITIVRLVALFMLAAGVLLFGPSTAFAQQQTTPQLSPLVGHWQLTSLTLEQGGKSVDMYGPNPQGLFIFDESGRYSIIIERRDVPNFASGNKATGTAEENRAAVQGNLEVVRRI